MLFKSKRYFWIGIGFAIGFLSLVGKLYYLQVKNYDHYAYRAIKQSGVELPLEEVPRGDILDRNGKSLLDKEQILGVAVFPALIEDNNKLSQQLSEILQIDHGSIKKKITGAPTFLKLGITKGEAKAIKNLKSKGLLVVPLEKRYGQGVVASHLIGHLGKLFNWQELEELNKSSEKPYFYNDLVGKIGLEQIYEHQLKGLRFTKVVRGFFDARQRLPETFIPGLGLKISSQKDEVRKNLKLTLDRDIQSKVEGIMDKTMPKGAVVVMDVATGDILAMASRPNFNPGKIGELTPDDLNNGVFVDRATSLTPPGSVFKIVVAAAAIENNLVSKGTPFFCAGSLDPLIKCTSKQGHGWISFSKAMAVSCNPTFARVGLKVGPKLLETYIEKFGLNDQSILGYPVKRDKRQQWETISQNNHFINSLIGQGETLATPIQITTMMNTVAAGGLYRKPRVVEAVVDDNNKGELFPREQGEQVISPTTAQELQELLYLVTSPGGTGHQANLGYLGSAGKTSSVEINKKKQVVNAWFSGFFPYQQPRYTITVMVEAGESGGKTAAPIFKEIAQAISQH